MQPFLCHRAGEVHRLLNRQCDMQNSIQLRQVQPSVLSIVGRIVKNLKAKFDQKVEESEFCQVLGITPWHFSLQGLAVTAFVGLVIILICGLAEWLEGGAA